MPKGRPRAFDTEQVLDAALDLFWRQGYDGTCMAELYLATGLKPGSIYTAFGSKLGLFERVVQHYVDTVSTFGPAAVQARTVAEVVRAWLMGAVDATTGPDTPTGCLTVQGALATGEAGAEARSVLCGSRLASQRLLAERFVLAQQAGDLPPHADPQTAARYIQTLTEGIAVQAASGATRDELHRMVDLLMTRLPWD